MFRKLRIVEHVRKTKGRQAPKRKGRHIMNPHVNDTHVRTGVVRLGNLHLYKPHAYKEKDAKETSGMPKYDLVLAFDKTGDKPDIKATSLAQQAAIQRLEARGEWDDTIGGLLAFKDADVSKVAESASSKKLVILSEKRPQLKGKWSLKLTAKANRRPTVKYVDSDGIIRDMPVPIIDPDPSNAAQVAEADARRALWDSLVYAGQNAVVSFTFTGWRTNLGQGTSANIDNILILGGGTPAGLVPFEEDFDAKTLDEVHEWVEGNVSRPESDVPDAVDEPSDDAFAVPAF